MIQKIPVKHDEFIISSAWFTLGTVFQKTFPELNAHSVYKILNVEHFNGDISNWGITKFSDIYSGQVFDVSEIEDFWCMFGPSDKIRILK